MRSEAYKEGYQSYRDGEAQQENPFEPLHQNGIDWDNGWKDARYHEYQRTHDDND